MAKADFKPFKVPLIIVGSVLILVIVAWVANSFPRKSVMDEYFKKEKARIIAEYEASIKSKDVQIEILTDRINASEEVLLDIRKGVSRLEDKKKNVTKPQTIKEIEDRFNNLGYTVIK